MKLRPNKKDAQQTATRITNDTVAEHREKVLAGGKKFKYPLQYARHKLVINTIILSIVAIVLACVAAWWTLYPNQNTSEFMYRVTRIVPVPVGNVNGEQIRYSDYLMKFRSAEYYLREKEQTNFSGEDGERQITYLKQQSLEDATADAYARQIAREQSVSVSDEELDEFLQRQKDSAGVNVPDFSYATVIRDYYDWSITEYRDTMRAKLLRQKVEYAIDTEAKSQSEQVAEYVTKNPKVTLQKVAEKFKAELSSEITYGDSGWVQHSNQDGGLSSEALKLKQGETSNVIQPIGGGGYYVVRLIDKNETQVRYEYVSVPLKKFSQQLNELYTNQEVDYYIDVPKPSENESAS